MKAALKDAIEGIQKAGFSHIKVELEGDLGRGDAERQDCHECDGRGEIICENCAGDGYTEIRERDSWGDVADGDECDDCYGEGRSTCYSCDGDGYTDSESWDESSCEQFIRNHVSKSAAEHLTYGNFYEDGSVDSEFTFTMPIEYVEEVLEYLEAFKALGDEIGNGVDVDGAGMHISVIPATSKGSYPCYDRLPSENLGNFVNQMSKLLPALFFCASASHQSRPLEYRNPRVSNDDKYSAIYTHGGTCFEYRVFETCYDHPERLLDYVQVIANSLRFFADPSLKVKELGTNFEFTDEYGHSCARFFSTTKQLRILNAQIKHLKPKDKTYKRMKQERGVTGTIKGLRLEESGLRRRLTEDYKQYKKHWETERSRPLTAEEQRRVDYYMIEYGYTRDQAVRDVRGGQSRLMSLQSFLERNIPKSYDVAVAV